MLELGRTHSGGFEPSLAEIRRLNRTEEARLIEQLAALGPEQWTARTPCPAWDVLDVVLHLVGVSDMHIRMESDAAAGHFRPPWGDRPQHEVWAEFDQRHRAQRAAGTEAAVEALRTASGRFDAFLAGLDPAALGNRCWCFGYDETVHGMLLNRLFDFLIHGSDSRRGAGVTPLFTAEGAEIAAALARRDSLRFFNSTAADGLTGAIRFEVGGDVWRVEIGDGGARIAEPRLGANATVRTDPGTFTLLVWGREPLAEAEAGGRATVAGDRELVARFFAGIKTP